MKDGVKELIVRTISGIVFVALMVYAILYSAPVFIVLFAIILGGCLWEFYKLRGVKDKWITYGVLGLIVLFYVSCLLLSKSSFDNSYMWYGSIIVGAVTFWYTMILLLIKAVKGKTAELLSLIVSFYILPAFFLLMFYLQEPKTLMSLFIIIWAGDVGAYCIGTLLGQGAHGHRLAPSVSPKKSWEGVAGGIVFAIAAALILNHIGWFRMFSELSVLWQFMLCALFAVVYYFAAIAGDLIESSLKRKAGVKDSGSIMPGHGGYLDRFDSILIAIPVAVTFNIIYLLIINLSQSVIY